MTDNNTDPIKDKGRIEEIARLQLHDDQVDEILNDYVQQAATEFDLPIGLVSVVLDDAQHFAASHGLSDWLEIANGSPVEWSFCANSVSTQKPFVVEDSESNEVVKNNPLVHHDDVKCYAGVPMITKNGYVVGNFCVIGDKSRNFTAAEVERLKEYAVQAVNRLEERVKNKP